MNNEIRMHGATNSNDYQQAIHAALHDVQHKVFERVQFLVADFGRGNAQHKKCT